MNYIIWSKELCAFHYYIDIIYYNTDHSFARQLQYSEWRVEQLIHSTTVFKFTKACPCWNAQSMESKNWFISKAPCRIIAHRMALSIWKDLSQLTQTWWEQSRAIEQTPMVQNEITRVGKASCLTHSSSSHLNHIGGQWLAGSVSFIQQRQCRQHGFKFARHVNMSFYSSKHNQIHKHSISAK